MILMAKQVSEFFLMENLGSRNQMRHIGNTFSAKKIESTKIMMWKSQVLSVICWSPIHHHSFSKNFIKV